jgi:hypothetical protein
VSSVGLLEVVCHGVDYIILYQSARVSVVKIMSSQ